MFDFDQKKLIILNTSALFLSVALLLTQKPASSEEKFADFLI
jgi:hypothetical protein